MEITALHLKTVADLCSKINDDIYIYFDNDKLIFQSVSESNVSLIECIVRSNIKKSDAIIYFKLSKIKNILSASENNDAIEILVDDGFISFKLKNITRNVRLFEPDKKRFIFPDERKEKPLIFTNEIDLFVDELLSSLTASNDLNVPLSIIIKNNKLELHKDDELVNFSSKLVNIKIKKSKGDIDNSYDSNLIFNIISKAKDKINMKISQDAPIKFENELYRDFNFKYMIAPLSKLD